MAVAYLSPFVVRLFTYLILNAAWRNNLVTQLAKNLSHWVARFRDWLTLTSPSFSVKDALSLSLANLSQRMRFTADKTSDTRRV